MNNATEFDNDTNDELYGKAKAALDAAYATLTRGAPGNPEQLGAIYWQVSDQFESLEQMMKAFKVRARALSNAVDPVPDFLMNGGSKKRSKNTRRKRRSVKTK